MKPNLLSNLWLTAFLFGLLTSCSGPIVIRDNGQTYNLSEDDPFTIELPGNPTTGYQWIILPWDEQVVVMDGEPEYQVKDDKIGSGGVYTYHFHTVGDGQTNLVFQYNRPWDTLKQPSRTFEVTIVCGTMGRILEE